MFFNSAEIQVCVMNSHIISLGVGYIVYRFCCLLLALGCFVIHCNHSDGENPTVCQVQLRHITLSHIITGSWCKLLSYLCPLSTAESVLPGNPGAVFSCGLGACSIFVFVIAPFVRMLVNWDYGYWVVGFLQYAFSFSDFRSKCWITHQGSFILCSLLPC